MQNVQNAAEIQQRVINLVELYRTKVGKDSQIAKDLAAEYKAQYDNEIDIAYQLHQEGIEGYCLNIDIPEEAVDAIRTNEQLLGYFYKKVAGDNADEDVTTCFLSDKFDSSVFTSEEEQFLTCHFAEMVNYIILTPNNDLSAIGREDMNDLYLLPTEVLTLIKERVVIPSGSRIYNPFSGLAQLACLYKESSFFCEESYQSYFKRWNAYCDELLETQHVIKDKYNENHVPALMKVALYANSIDVTVIEDGIVPQTYDAVISYIPFIPKSIPNYSYYLVGDESSDAEIIKKIQLSYQNLKEGGKMVLILPTEYLWKRKSLASVEKVSFELELEPLWKQLIADNSLFEIIHLPAVMGKSLNNNDFCVLIAEKGHDGIEATLIDARFASVKSEDKLFNLSLDLDSLHAMMDNGGKEPGTGLRKMDQFPIPFISSDLLVPQVYVVEKPSEAMPVSLADICTLETSHIYDVQFDLPEDTPCIGERDLSATYTGPIDATLLPKANCPNNPQNWRFGTTKLSRFALGARSDISQEDLQISWYRNCWYIDGSKDAVLFKFTKDGIATALVNATGKAIAVNPDIRILYPNKDFDAFSLLSILNMPVVYRQLAAHLDFAPYEHLMDIIVPTDNKVINDEKNRLVLEQDIRDRYEAKIAKLRKDQMDRLSNYQHGMRKHIREISSSLRRMERFINDLDSSDETKKFLNDRLNVIKSHRLYLSEDIERLNEENTYGEASPFDIDHSLRNYRDYFGADVCSVKYTNEIANDAIRQYMKEHQEELKNLDEKSRNENVEVVFVERSRAYVDIAEYNFGKIVRNILENAKKHGFDDFNDVNHNDCVIEIVLSWDEEKQMYRIDFRNNGNLLPEGLTKASYGENRKYAGKTGGTGIGGYEVAENVRHYNGDYSISQNGDWVVVSIYLPKSKTYGEGV